MFIIELTYKVPPETIDANMDAHIDFLEKYYKSGHFLASGRKEPRDGGLIFAKASNRKRVEEINRIVLQNTASLNLKPRKK